MLQYIWINNYKIIKQQGFNFSSNGKFEFILDENKREDDKIEIKGDLTYNKLDTPQIFASYFSSMTLIVGSNGSGKTTLIDQIISAIIKTSFHRFDGIIVFNNYIFIPDNYEINCPPNYEIKRHVDLVNYKRKARNEEQVEYPIPMLNDIDANRQYGQIASTYLKKISMINYSSHFNLDNIHDIEGVAGSTEAWETDYNHLIDISTENIIVRDLKLFDRSYSDRILLSGKSELLSHKSEESKRILSFISSSASSTLPFYFTIKYGKLDFNHNYKKSLEKFLGTIEENLFTQLELKLTKVQSDNNLFEKEFYLSFLYGAILKELRETLESTNVSNALELVIGELLQIIEKKDQIRDILVEFIENAKFVKNQILPKRLMNSIDGLLLYIVGNKAFVGHSQYGCNIDLKKIDIEQWKQKTYSKFRYKSGIDFLFDVFSLTFDGLSGGEKNLLSFFGRIYSSITQQLKENYQETEEFVVFIDELDNNLHPAWQIKLFDILHTILPQLLPNRKLQLILCSHSPILVSDFPKNNIIFLDKDKSGNCRVVDPMTRDNTFGANIQTLYRNSFFLNGLPIGEFAKKKINELFNELEQGVIRDTTLQEMQLIGEPILKNQLMKLYKQHKDLPSSVDLRVTELEEEVRILKNKLNDKN